MDSDIDPPQPDGRILPPRDYKPDRPPGGGPKVGGDAPTSHGFVTGHDLSRAESRLKAVGLLAPEGCFVGTTSASVVTHPEPFARPDGGCRDLQLPETSLEKNLAFPPPSFRRPVPKPCRSTLQIRASLCRNSQD